MCQLQAQPKALVKWGRKINNGYRTDITFIFIAIDDAGDEINFCEAWGLA